MRNNNSLTRVIALAVVTGLLAACGGGGHNGSILPTGGGTTAQKTPAPKSPTSFKLTLPAPVGGSTSKRPNYISASGTSSLVVSVVPTDPAEAAQWATLYGASGFSVCYDLFNNGVVDAVAPVVVTGPVAGVYTVTFPFPSPPGQDTFTMTQYAGACSATNPYSAPTAPPSPVPTLSPAQLILSQSPPLVVNLTAGVTNNFNVQLSACSTTPSGPVTQPAPVTCAVPNPVGTTSITPVLGASVNYAYLGAATPALPITLAAPVPLPISEPMREQHVFTAAGYTVGVPIPVVGLDGGGNVVPYTPPVLPNTVPSSGLFPNGANNPNCTTSCTDHLTITLTETPSAAGHFKLYLLDATTGAVAQTAADGAAITLTQLNALDAADNVSTLGVVGDPYVLVAAFDGSSATSSTSMTATMTGQLGGSALTSTSTTITPQAALFTAVAAGPGTGYTDAAAPYVAAADILNIPSTTANVAAAGQGYWVSDGGELQLVGTATAAGNTVTGATTLTAMTLDSNANLTAGRILAVDNSQLASTSTGAAIASGIYVFDPVGLTSKPLAVQDLTTGNWVSFGAPNAIAFVPGGYVYVAAGNSIYAIDPTSDGAGSLATQNAGAMFSSEEIGSLPISGLSGNATGFDMYASGTNLILADTGNNRIISINTATCVPGGAACTPTVIASGHAFVGVAANGANYVATDTAGQIYTITSAGVVTSLGLTGGAVKDGVVGVLGVTPLAPVPYTTQGQAGNFFNTTPTESLPYDVSPFVAAGPIFAAAAQTAVGTTGPTFFEPDTSNANFGTTAGTTDKGFGIAFVPAANVGANGALTANSYLFTDNGSLRTLVP